MPTVTLTITCERPSVADISGSAAAAGLRVKPLSSTKLCIYAHMFSDIETWAAPYEGIEGITTVYNKIAPPASYTLDYTAPESTDSTAFAFDVSGYTVPPSTFKPFYTPSTSYPPNAYYRTQRYMTASDLASIYKIPTPDPFKEVVVGVVSYHGHIYGTADSNGRLLTGDPYTYWTSIGIPTNLQPMVLLVNTDGSPVSISPTPPASFDSEFLESTLDICMIGGACPSPNLTIILYNCVNEPSTASYYNKICNVPVIYNGKSYLPSIVSISYGGYEQFLNNGILQTNMDVVIADTVFQSASARGVNICAAAGNSGSQVHWNQPGYNVSWPASSAYVTAVGGTRLFCPNYTYDSFTYEFVWNMGEGNITGGGYSSIFPKPSYQNRIPGTMRAIPDISLMAESKIALFYSGSPATGFLYLGGGTSAATPLFAGFLACICPTTFVNPILYTADSRCFHDITSGDNRSGGNPGYFAGTGYDLASGLGSIAGNFLASVIAPHPVINMGCELQ